MEIDTMLKERIEYGKKLCKQEKNNWGDFTYSLIESLEEQLALCSVSDTEGKLKAFVEEYVEAFEDGQGSDTALYRQAKSLL